MSGISRHGKKWIAGLSAFALAAGAVVGLVAPVASAQVIPPTSSQVALNVKVDGDRTGATSNGTLAGVTVALSGSPEITCVSDADGDCTLLVPTSMTSTSASTRFTARVVSAPDGWYDTTYPGTVTWLVPAGPAGGLTYSSSEPIVMARTNPPVVCGQTGLKVAMMVDLSASMATNNAIDVLKRDAKGYVSALAGTNASIALFTFSSKSPANGSTNVNRPLTPVATQADVNRLNGWIDGWVTADGTNWDDAFWTVAQDPTVFNLLIFITDGMPMTSRNPVPNSLFGAFIKDDAASANAVKLQGTRIIVIAVGTDFIANDMESVSGTKVGDTTDPVSNDYFMPTNWGDASKVFDALTQVCSVPTSTVEVGFMDDDTGQPVTPLAGFQTTLTGSVGDPVGFDEQAASAGYDPSLYEFVSMDDVPVYTTDPQTLTVHLKHVKVAEDVPVTHTVRYVGTPTPIADDVSTITWTMTTDQVTSTSVCTTTSTEFPAVTSPLVPTYTADQLVVPAIPVTSPSAACPPANIVDTVTYTKIPDGTVDVVFFDVDDQVPVTPVAGFQTSFSGQPGTDVGFTEDMAKAGFDASKYVYVSFTNVLTFTPAPQTITVNVQHKITPLASTTTRTITYVGSGSTSIPDVVSVVNWAGTRDEATGVSQCATSDAGYPAVTSPDVYGYTSDPAVVPAEAAVTPQETCPTQDSTVAVTYTRIPDGTVQVVFFDVDDQVPVTPVAGFQTSFAGLPGEDVGFTEDMAKAGFDTSKYVYVSFTNVLTFTPAPQTITVRLQHKITDLASTTTRTITYVGSGSTSIPDVVSVLNWAGTRDEATGVSVCMTSDAGYPAVTSPDVYGYTSDPAVVPAEAAVTPQVTCPTQNSTVTVTYTRIPDGTVQVVFFDVDDQVPVTPVAGFQTSFAGLPGEDVGFTEEMARSGFDASKYVYVSFTNVLTFTPAPQTITVRLQHKITPLASTTSRTITYVGSGSTSIPDVVSVLNWAGTRDEATGVSVCMTSDAGYPQVVSPDVYGYTSDPAVVPAQAATTPQETCPTQNTTVTVTYTRIPDGTVQVVFFDVDDQVPVTPVAGFQTSFAGLPGEDVGFTEDMAKAGFDATKYVYVSFTNVLTFTAAPQTITVRVQHKITPLASTTTRTIHYVGSGSTSIPDVVSVLHWSGTRDEATSVSQCATSDAGYPAVTSPDVYGYTSDPAVVPAQAATTPQVTCPTQNSTVTVTYTRIPDGTVQVVFFDVDSQTDVTPVAGFQTSFAGLPGEDVGFTEDMAKAGFDTSKYVYVSFTNALTFTAAPQTITVRVQHKITPLASTTTRTIHYVGSGSTSIPDVVSVLHWSGTRDEATSVSQCATSDAGYPAVTSPDVYGYTSDPAVVPAQAATTPQVTCPTQNSTVTVTYTRIPDGTVQVVFFDVDSQTDVTPVAGFQTSFAGLPGEDVGFTEAMAKSGFDATKYVYVSFTNALTFTPAPQTITVRLQHKITPLASTTTRTIHYVGSGSTSIDDVVSTLQWAGTRDEATGVSQCSTSDAGYPAVTSPDVYGFTVDPVEVPAVAASTPQVTCPTQNSTVTVTYTRIPDGTVQVVLVDDKTGTPIDPVAGVRTVMSGLPGESVGFTQDDAMAAIDTSKYVFVSVDNVTEFPVDAATITIHVTHLMIPYKVPIDRIVHYVGAGTIPDAVSTVTWTKTVDAVTLDEVCTTTQTSYPPVTSPVVDGYTVDPDVVPPLAVTSPAATCPTQNIEVTATYTEIPIEPVVVQTGGTTAGLATLPVAAWILCLLGMGAAFFGIRRWVTGR